MYALLALAPGATASVHIHGLEDNVLGPCPWHACGSTLSWEP
jgi:hypothetical protein